MFSLSREEIIETICPKTILNGASLVVLYSELTIDTRSLNEGSIYLAIKGPRFDGHNFLEQAENKGAELLIVDHIPNNFIAQKTLLVVENTLEAYEKIAIAIKDKLAMQTVAITGSYGKTTTKDLLAHILSKKAKCLFSQGTENNNIGVPKTLMKASKNDKFTVLELGTNHFGEIAHLSHIAKPDCVILTGISVAHTEFLGDINGVLREKSSVFEVCPQAQAILNADDPLLRTIDLKTKAILYGQADDADISWKYKSETEQGIIVMLNGQYELTLNTKAVFNANNACAAIATAKYLGIDIDDSILALADFEFPKMRFEMSQRNGIIFINDAYNANPYAFKESLKSCAQLSAKRKILVLADMAELGKENQSAHESLADDIVDMNADNVLLLGPSMRYTYEALNNSTIKKEYFSSKEELTKVLNSIAENGDLVFLKGSRVFALETLLASF